MKQILAFAMMLLPLFDQARAGDHVGNGGGLAEKNIVQAYNKIEDYIDLCLQAASCQLTEREQDLLENIRLAVPSEKASKQLKFASEKAEPGTFIIDGELKVAKTGSTVGSPIFFNIDLLYTKDHTGHVTAMGLADALAHLIHELGHHHQGDYTHAELDALGVKVSQRLTERSQFVPFVPMGNEIGALFINRGKGPNHTQVLLYVFDELTDLTEQFNESITCTRLSDPNDGTKKGIVTSPPLSSVFHNIYWDHYRISDEKGRLILKGFVTNVCRNSSGKVFEDKGYRATISFEIMKVVKADGQPTWKLKPGSAKMGQHFEPWWKILKLPRIW